MRYSRRGDGAGWVAGVSVGVSVGVGQPFPLTLLVSLLLIV